MFSLQSIPNFGNGVTQGFFYIGSLIWDVFAARWPDTDFADGFVASTDDGCMLKSGATCLNVITGTPNPTINARNGAIFFTFLIFLGAFICGLMNCTAGARFIYSLARDGGLPFSSWLRVVNERNGVPLNALGVFFVISICFLTCNLGARPFTAYNAVSGISANGYLLACASLAQLRSRRTGLTRPRVRRHPLHPAPHHRPQHVHRVARLRPRPLEQADGRPRLGGRHFLGGHHLAASRAALQQGQPELCAPLRHCSSSAPADELRTRRRPRRARGRDRPLAAAVALQCVACSRVSCASHSRPALTLATPVVKINGFTGPSTGIGHDSVRAGHAVEEDSIKAAKLQAQASAAVEGAPV